MSHDPAEAFKYFWLLFRREAFEDITAVREGQDRQQPFLNHLLDDCQDYAKELGDRLKERVCVVHPNGEWVAQMARNIRMWWEEHGIRPSHIIKDRDTRFTSRFDGILKSIGAKVKPISRGSPNLNPYAEAWVGTFRRECLDKFIVFGEGHLDYICRVYEAWYNVHRPHSSLGNEVIGLGEMPGPDAVEEKRGVVRESWLGGALRHCRRAAA